MKSTIAIVVALAAAFATAAPANEARTTCTPATYACATNPTTGVDGWQVCDVTSTWVVSVLAAVLYHTTLIPHV